MRSVVWRGRALFVFRNAAASLTLLGVAATAQAPLDIRVALVIGNSAYAGPAALVNPANDAAAMAATLKRLGFTVTELRDGSRAQMAEAITAVRERLRGKQAVGLFYYAGHGLQLEWRNYMVPVDAKLGSAADVTGQAVDVEAVIGAFKAAGNRMNIVVLDACRDNPFPSGATGKGLAQMDAPPGTFLAYATAPGNVAEDGDVKSGNGLYTQYLLAELQRPAARIEDVFKRVRLQVRQQSKGRQIPWESTSLEEEFFFDPRGDKRAPRLGSKEDDALFALERGAWDRIKDAGKPEDFYAFLQLFPNGRFSEQADFRLNQREKPQVLAAPIRRDAGATAPDPLAAGRQGERFRAGDRFSFAVKDGFSGAVKGTYRFEVASVDGDRVIALDTESPVRVDAMGAVSEDRMGTFDPPWVLLPSEFAIGHRWQGRTVWSPRNWPPGRFDFTSRVTGRERITTPAGSFDAWVIETRGAHARPHAGTVNSIQIKVWAVPYFGVPVRLQILARNSWQVERTEIVELAGFEAGR